MSFIGSKSWQPHFCETIVFNKQEKMKCKNCENIVDGKFCSLCGQNSNVRRIDIANFINEVSASVFQLDKGFFYTLKELFQRPGKSINEYLNGKRKNHFKPIAYLLTLSTLYFLITQISNQNTWVDDLITGWMNGAAGEDSQVEIPKIAKWFAKNYAYSTLILLPVFSLASYLSFLKFDKNYLEHVVINSYITGHQAIIYFFFAIAGTFIESDVIETFPLLLAVPYNIWVFGQLFMNGNRTMNLLRMIMTYILYLIFSLVLLMLLAGISEI